MSRYTKQVACKQQAPEKHLAIFRLFKSNCLHPAAGGALALGVQDVSMLQDQLLTRSVK